MDLRQLEYFVRVAELGSFTRASIALNIAQPALSRQVRLLEVEVRQSLLIRNGRGVTMTEAGKLLLEHGLGILHQVRRTQEELTRVRGELAGRVALGLPPSLSRVLTVPLMREIRRRLPEASLSIGDGLSITMQEALTAGRLDIALLYNAPPSPEIDTTPLLEEDLFLIEHRSDAQPPQPIRLHDIATRALVIPSRPHSLRMLVETELGNLGLHPTIAMEIDSVAVIPDLVAEGAGCAILSMNAITALADPGRFKLRPIVEPTLRSKLAIAVSARRPSTLTQQATVEIVRDTTIRILDPDRA
ncbi:LysR substrate-binding domain-containing protein [Rhodocyclaceae bacterium SMB388]